MDKLRNILKSDTPVDQPNTAHSAGSGRLAGQGSHFPGKDEEASTTTATGSTLPGTDSQTRGPTDVSAAPVSSTAAATTTGPEQGGSDHINTTSASSALPATHTHGQTLTKTSAEQESFGGPKDYTIGSSDIPESQTFADDRGTAAIGQTSTYSSSHLTRGDPTSSVVDPESSDPLTYKKPEAGTHSTGSGVGAGAATTAASLAFSQGADRQKTDMSGHENPYLAQHLDPRVDGMSRASAEAAAVNAPRNTSATTPSHGTTTGGTTGLGSDSAGTGASSAFGSSSRQPHDDTVVPSTLSTTVDPTERSAEYGSTTEHKGLPQTEPDEHRQSMVGRMLGAVGLGGYAGALGAGSTPGHESSAVADTPEQPTTTTGLESYTAPTQQGPPTSHHRKESIPTTAYPSGTFDSPRAINQPIGGAGSPVVHGDSQGHTGRDVTTGVAAGGAAIGAAAVGTHEYGQGSALHENVVGEPRGSAPAFREASDTTTSGGFSMAHHATTLGDGPTSESLGTGSYATQPEGRGSALTDRTVGGGTTGVGGYGTEKATDQSYTTPSTEQFYTAPTTTQSYTTPRTEQSYTAPTTEQSYTAPRTEQAYTSPTTDKMVADDHTARNTAIGTGAGAAAVGAGAYGAHEYSKKEAEKAEMEAAKEQAAREKELARQRSAQEKELEKHHKAEEKAAAKEEKHHQKELEKEEKKHHKELEKDEKKHAEAVALKDRREHERQQALLDKQRAEEAEERKIQEQRRGIVGGTDESEKEKKPSIFKRIFKRRQNKDTGLEEEYSSEEEHIPSHNKEPAAAYGAAVVGLGGAAAHGTEHDNSHTAANTYGNYGTSSYEQKSGGAQKPSYNPFHKGDKSVVDAPGETGPSTGTTGITGTQGRQPSEAITGLPYDPSKDPEAAHRLSEHHHGQGAGTYDARDVAPSTVGQTGTYSHQPTEAVTGTSATSGAYGQSTAPSTMESSGTRTHQPTEAMTGLPSDSSRGTAAGQGLDDYSYGSHPQTNVADSSRATAAGRGLDDYSYGSHPQTNVADSSRATAAGRGVDDYSHGSHSQTNVAGEGTSGHVPINTNFTLGEIQGKEHHGQQQGGQHHGGHQVEEQEEHQEGLVEKIKDSFHMGGL